MDIPQHPEFLSHLNTRNKTVIQYLSGRRGKLETVQVRDTSSSPFSQNRLLP